MVEWEHAHQEDGPDAAHRYYTKLSRWAALRGDAALSGGTTLAEAVAPLDGMLTARLSNADGARLPLLDLSQLESPREPKPPAGVRVTPGRVIVPKLMNLFTPRDFTPRPPALSPRREATAETPSGTDSDMGTPKEIPRETA